MIKGLCEQRPFLHTRNEDANTVSYEKQMMKTGSEGSLEKLSSEVENMPHFVFFGVHIAFIGGA